MSLGLSIGWWIVNCGWVALVALSSLRKLWPLPPKENAALICGLVLLAIGVAMVSAGVMEFHSLRKISDMKVSKLIITGIYS